MPARSCSRGPWCCLYLSSTLYHALAPEQGEKPVPGHRSQCNLSSHRGDLHPVHARRPARRLGLDPVRSGVERCGSRHHPEGGWRYPLSPALNRPVYRDGMDRGDRDTASVATHAGLRVVVDNSWRTCVHRGHHFLRRRSAGQVWPFRVAFVCPAGNRLSLLRGAVVCDLGTGGQGNCD